jgi:hypothetical protein
MFYVFQSFPLGPTQHHIEHILPLFFGGGGGGGKLLRETNDLPPPRAKVKNRWSFTSCACICHSVHKDNILHKSQIFQNECSKSLIIICKYLTNYVSRKVSGSIPSGVAADFFRGYRWNHVPWGRLSL